MIDNINNLIAQSNRPKKPWHKKWRLWLIVFFVIYIIIMVGVIYFNADKNTKTNNDLLNKNNQVDEDLVYQGAEANPAIGNKQAKVRIVEFSDFQCPYCREAFPIMREIIAQYQDKIYFLYRNFPVAELHPLAAKAAEAGLCANEQGKFWQLHDKIFINQDALSLENLKSYAKEVGLNQTQFNQCLDSDKYAQAVYQDLLAGQKLEVKGTPTFFINGYRITGVIPKEMLIDLINKGLSE